MGLPHDRQALADSLALSFFADFARQYWHLATGGRGVVWSWYLRVLADEMQAALEGDRDTVVWLPPGVGKTTMLVLLSAWWWLHKPGTRYLSASRDRRLSARDSRRMRAVISSPEYARLASLVGADVRLSRDQSEKMDFETLAGGKRLAVSTQSGSTGERCDVFLLDDLLDVRKVNIGSAVQVADRVAEVWTMVTEVWLSRFELREGGGRGPFVSIGQSTHPDDPGQRLARDFGAHVVCLPMEYDPTHPHIHPDDPRTEPGELLCPAIFDEARAERTRRQAGERVWDTQYQQRPTVREGGILQRGWFSQEYPEHPAIRARQCSEVIITVDCAQERGAGHDYTVMQAWGRMGHTMSLLGERRFRGEITDQIPALRSFYQHWLDVAGSRLGAVVVEKASNGVTMLQMRPVPGMVKFSPHGKSKEERAHPFALKAEAGEVYVPTRDHAPWVGDVIDEWCGFGVGASHDDRTDAAAMAATRWHQDVMPTLGFGPAFG